MILLMPDPFNKRVDTTSVILTVDFHCKEANAATA